ncbi:MAG: DUF4178 domain-containing protein [Verrucomicrobia bacterium]|nr:MAG: DUF4178 domain-containing protein [Verrucomicrobiota bacterium]
MSYANPTLLRLGMTGTLAGRQYRVAGRVVMGADVGGTTYYWNEFNIVSDGGESATLVYEETERGGEWKLFTLFEPESPMSPAEAATRRVGDSVTLDGMVMSVTLVDESRVYHIEGEAPEGVEVGDIAHYFNAQMANRMVVVSWTGDEVEYYRGATLPMGVVNKAFGVAESYRSEFAQTSAFSGGAGSRLWDEGQQSSGRLLLVVLAVLLSIIGVGFFSPASFSRRPPKIQKTTAAPAQLKVGDTLNLDGKQFQVKTHSIVEVAEVGRWFERHEYQLADGDGVAAWLVENLSPTTKGFYFFTALEPTQPMSAAEAATLPVGKVVNVEGIVAPVKEIFRCATRQVEGDTNGAPKVGEVSFGFSAEAGPILLLARWNNSEIKFLRGRAVSAEVREARR